MKPRVGVLPLARPADGGAYPYAVQMRRSLQQAEAFEPIFQAEGPATPPSDSLLSRLKGRIEAWIPRGATRLRRVLPSRRRWKTLRRWFDGERLSLLVLCKPSLAGFESGLPFVMPIHDVQHRLNPQFPEVSAAGEWSRREYLFGGAARHARRILVDSDVGKADVIDAYGIAPERVCVLPFVPAVAQRPPASTIDAVRRKHDLPERYFFYPARLWKHKNHARLVEAVGLLPHVRLVLVGGPENGLEEYRRAVERSGAAGRIRWLGHVADAELSALYAGSAGLVMPTFFGPTNIPILEAFALGVPVITSDIRGVREQVGDAALTVDPRSVESIAEAMERLWADAALGRSLAKKGATRAAENTEERFTATLLRTLEAVVRDGGAVRPGSP